MSAFIRLGDTLVPLARVLRIDAGSLQTDGELEVWLDGVPQPIRVAGGLAVDLVMRIDPSFFEGRRFNYVRSSWAFHNLVAHPLLQLFAWAGRTRAGLAIHDATVSSDVRREP
jgi:hypothetical protein